MAPGVIARAATGFARHGLRRPPPSLTSAVRQPHRSTMPLALDDPRWNALLTAYGLSCDDVIKWLRKAYQEGMTSELLGDIINDIQHQGDTSQSMYAVAPHLIALASDSDDAVARDMVIHA